MTLRKILTGQKCQIRRQSSWTPEALKSSKAGQTLSLAIVKGPYRGSESFKRSGVCRSAYHSEASTASSMRNLRTSLTRLEVMEEWKVKAGLNKLDFLKIELTVRRKIAQKRAEAKNKGYALNKDPGCLSLAL